MTTKSVHGNLINKAAKQILSPLGCRQKGSSRLWYDDNQWWAVVVEFQPSAWAQGSYLNVGAMWFWNAKAHWSFNEGYRVETFHEFKTEEQFNEVALELANRAASEVKSLREKFRSIAAVADYMAQKPKASIWEHYHAAIAFGLAGDCVAARTEFAMVQASTHDVPWVLSLKERTAELASGLDSPADFREMVLQEIQAARTLLRLPTLNSEQILQAWGD